LTKPLGTGIITTAIKCNMAAREDIEAVTAMMTRLNNIASELMLQFDAHAATDITGYGLLGHAYEMAAASNIGIVFHYDTLPLLPNVLKYAKSGAIPGGSNANREYLVDKVTIPDRLSVPMTEILFDPQTSGGLLISLPKENAAGFIREAALRQLPVFEIGEVVAKGAKAITVD